MTTPLQLDPPLVGRPGAVDLAPVQGARSRVFMGGDYEISMGVFAPRYAATANGRDVRRPAAAGRLESAAPLPEPPPAPPKVGDPVVPPVPPAGPAIKRTVAGSGTVGGVAWTIDGSWSDAARLADPTRTTRTGTIQDDVSIPSLNIHQSVVRDAQAGDIPTRTKTVTLTAKTFDDAVDPKTPSGVQTIAIKNKCRR